MLEFKFGFQLHAETLIILVLIFIKEEKNNEIFHQKIVLFIVKLNVLKLNIFLSKILKKTNELILRNIITT